jgi:hypothetical protein
MIIVIGIVVLNDPNCTVIQIRVSRNGGKATS